MKKHLIRDFMTIEHECHGGEGEIQVFRPFDAKQNLQKLDFLDFVIVPPGSTIGRHRHGNNQEWYVIIKGRGSMFFANQNLTIEPMDVLVNPPFGEHGLVNNSSDHIHLIVFQFSGENCHGTN